MGILREFMYVVRKGIQHAQCLNRISCTWTINNTGVITLKNIIIRIYSFTSKTFCFGDMYKTSDQYFLFGMPWWAKNRIYKYKINRSKLLWKCLQKYIMSFKPKCLYMKLVHTMHEYFILETFIDPPKIST